MVAGLEPARQVLPRRRRQQVAPDARHVDVGHQHLGERRVGRLQRDRILTLADRALERGFDIAVAPGPLRDQPLPLQRGEIHRLEQLGPDAADQVGIASRGEPQLGPRDGQRGRQQALVDDAHRGGGLRHPVDVDVGAAHLARLVLVGADLDALLQRQALVLVDEAEQRRLSQALEEHRLVVRQHAHVEEHPLRVQRHQQVDRRARIAGHRREVERLEDVAHQHRAGQVVLEQRPHRQLRVAVADGQRQRKEFCQPLLGERAGRCGQPDRRQGEPQRKCPQGWPHPAQAAARGACDTTTHESAQQ